jgi:acetylornithine deacetylase
MAPLCDARSAKGGQSGAVIDAGALSLPHQRRGEPLPAVVAEAAGAVTAERLVALLQELIAVPSVTGTAAESEAQHLLGRRFDAMGLDTDLWSIDLPAVMRHPDFPGLEAPRDEAWGLVGTWRGTHADAPTLVLNGHIDVVPPGSLGDWTGTPWDGAVRDGRVHGRGACDMKGGLACAVVAVQALREAGATLRGTVLLESVVGEEDGGLGTFATLQRGYRGDLAVVPEPTSTDLVVANGGALTFRLHVPGRSVHASVRTEGVDAVEKYLLVHSALRELEARRNTAPHPLMAGHRLPYPLSVGTVRAGDWASSVPDLLVAEGRLGVALGETVEEARRQLEDAVAGACAADPWLRDNPVRVEWFGGQFASGLLRHGSPLLPAMAAAHARVSSRTPQVLGAPWGSDLRLLTGLGGIDTLHYGPGDVRLAHAPDESVPVDELVTVAQAFVMLVAQACGAA